MSSAILNSLRSRKQSGEILSEVILKMFKGDIDLAAFMSFLPTVPQQFVTSQNTSILDEYIACKYYDRDCEYRILRAIIAHDPTTLNKPIICANYKAYYIGDLTELPKSMISVINGETCKKEQINKFERKVELPMYRASMEEIDDNLYDFINNSWDPEHRHIQKGESGLLTQCKD